jgi:hypothetical protein
MCGGQDPQKRPVRLVRLPVKLSEGPFNQDVPTRSMIASLKRNMRVGPTPEQVRHLMSELDKDIGQDIGQSFPVSEPDEADAGDVTAVTAS